MLEIPRLVIAAPHSGAGKTTVSLALALAFRRLGLLVQPFKVGPDYIDPTHLGRVAGRIPRNLDRFFLDREALRWLFARATRDADLALIEGVMGLFDGKDARGQKASTAAVARDLMAPVVLVVDAQAMAGSIAALARGFCDHDPEVRVAGVIANRVAGPRHAAILREALRAVGLPLLGYLPRDPALTLPERHLGLVLAGEVSLPDDALAAASRTLDVEALLQVARLAPPLPRGRAPYPQDLRFTPARIALARDEAFSFYYPEVLEMLEDLGAEFLPMSPLRDQAIPEGAGAIWLGGGYPEHYARGLAENRAMREAIRRFPGPIYAECGGYIYLSQALWWQGRRYPMVGLCPGEARMRSRPTLGYREVRAIADTPFVARGMLARGHEFHYAERPPSPRPVWQNVADGKVEGCGDSRVHASFVHLYLLSSPGIARRFLEAAGGRLAFGHP